MLVLRGSSASADGEQRGEIGRRHRLFGGGKQDATRSHHRIPLLLKNITTTTVLVSIDMLAFLLTLIGWSCVTPLSADILDNHSLAAMIIIGSNYYVLHLVVSAPQRGLAAAAETN